MSNLQSYKSDEVCEMLKLTKRGLYNFIKDGSLKCYKLGREYRFTEDDIKDFIESRRGTITKNKRK